MNVTLITVDPEVNITLSQYEAEILVRVLANVGGRPSGRRADMDRLFSQLVAAGIKNRSDEIPVEGSITI